MGGLAAFELLWAGGLTGAPTEATGDFQSVNGSAAVKSSWPGTARGNSELIPGMGNRVDGPVVGSGRIDGGFLCLRMDWPGSILPTCEAAELVFGFCAPLSFQGFGCSAMFIGGPSKTELGGLGEPAGEPAGEGRGNALETKGG